LWRNATNRDEVDLYSSRQLALAGTDAGHLIQGKGILMLQLILAHARRDEDGASAVEYGLLVAGIAALIVAVVFLFGGVIQSSFQGTCDAIKTGSAAAQTC
jgi:pilus assembly protein Flp/PilA